MGRILIGAKVRERRKALGITQAALAARLGISASYLTLIEADRRNIGGALLKRIAEELGAPLEEFGGAAQRRLADALGEITADPLLAPLHLDPGAAADLASRNPAWAQALVRLHRAYADRSAAVTALADRLNHDPFLAETVHSMLTNVSAIRSAAEILHGEADVPPAQRERFVTIIADDSRRLSDVSRALAGFLTQAQAATRSTTPAEEVDDFLAAFEHHFPGLEDAAEDLRHAAGVTPGESGVALARWLRDVHGVQLVRTARPGGAGPRRRRAHFDGDRGLLEVLAGAPESTLQFELARVAAQLGAEKAVDAALAAAPLALSAGARLAARHALVAYVAAAILMPYAEFLAAARTLRNDVDLLAARFQASFEQASRRLVTLRRPGAQGIRFGLLRCDASGRVTRRVALPRLPLPAQGPACPLWAVFTAFQSGGALVRQLAQFPGGDRYLMVARAVEKAGPGFGLPRRLVSVMLVCESLDAAQTVYGDGLDLSERAPAVPVGQACRVCVRQGCAHRQEDPIVAWPAAAARGSRAVEAEFAGGQA